MTLRDGPLELEKNFVILIGLSELETEKKHSSNSTCTTSCSLQQGTISYGKTLAIRFPTHHHHIEQLIEKEKNSLAVIKPPIDTFYKSSYSSAI